MGVLGLLMAHPFERYEPWDAYRAPQGKEARKQPYHSLLELIGHIDSGELGPDDRDLAIAEWCGEHGLLGVAVGHRYVAGIKGLPEAASLTTLGFDDGASDAYLRTSSESVEAFLIAGRLLRSVVE
jgi:hypothetical protein